MEHLSEDDEVEEDKFADDAAKPKSTTKKNRRGKGQQVKKAAARKAQLAEKGSQSAYKKRGKGGDEAPKANEGFQVVRGGAGAKKRKR